MNTISSTVVTSPEDIALNTDIKYKNPVLKRINDTKVFNEKLKPIRFQTIPKPSP